MLNAITDVEGIKVGHHTDLEAGTGCTVILCEEGAVAGVDVRGSASGTRETELLRPMNLVQEVNAVVLAGGSAFGLDAAGGVMRYLEESGRGFQTPAGRVPIVPAAVLFDLGLGNPKVRPDAEAGYRACLTAASGEVAEGNVGAGTGATIGKSQGDVGRMKGGVGTASRALPGGIVIGAIVAVNAGGDVVDPDTGRTVAGARMPGTARFAREAGAAVGLWSAELENPVGNTTLGAVATNAVLTKEEANKLAQMAQDGLALAIRPCHTMADGDTVFALATGKAKPEGVSLSALGAVAAEVVAAAILRAVRQAETLLGVPGLKGG
ncbi:MAG: P1 family peptidase [Chloroflexi bacterium]|nr:P1 family peptidase [Chloroflexota bacterium]